MFLLDEKELSLCRISDSDSVLVAFSGGADSVALLMEMKRLKDEGKVYSVAAAHLNHGIRDIESDRDALFCKETAEKFSIPYFEEITDVKEEARKRKMSLEEAAREVRYAFLERIRAKNGFSCIVTGHHADDQTETVLMHLIRGCGLNGLRGMSFRKDAVARPFLHISKQKILAFLQEHEQEYCEDSTNTDLYYFRNAVRFELIPWMEKWNPGIRESILRMSGSVSEDSGYLEDAAEQAYRNILDRRQIALIDTPIRMRVLRRYLPYESYERKDLETLDDLLTAQTGTCRNLKNGFCAWVSSDRLIAGKTERISYETPLKTGEFICVPTGKLYLENVGPELFQPDPNTAYLDCSKINGKLVARSMREGDRFAPLGANGTKLLSDYLTDRKVPRFERNMPVICDNDGILYVAGHIVDERAKVTGKSEQLIRIVYKEDKEHVG